MFITFDLNCFRIANLVYIIDYITDVTYNKFQEINHLVFILNTMMRKLLGVNGMGEEHKCIQTNITSVQTSQLPWLEYCFDETQPQKYPNYHYIQNKFNTMAKLFKMNLYLCSILQTSLYLNIIYRKFTNIKTCVVFNVISHIDRQQNLILD